MAGFSGFFIKIYIHIYTEKELWRAASGERLILATRPRFTQLTILLHTLLRMQFLGAVRKLSPCDQRFHRMVFLTANSFEFATFLRFNLFD